MTAWAREDLARLGDANEVEIAPRRRDGTLRRPVTVWVVRNGDDLYVRSWKGRAGAWYRGTQARHEGRIQAGGVERDVSFVAETDPDVNVQIDAAYRAKYRGAGGRYVDPMVAPEARATTLKLVAHG